MIIFMQDKTGFVNFNNVTSVGLEELHIPFDDDEEKKCCITARTPADETVVLGYYKSAARARDILEKLANAIGLGMYKYDMPQK